MSRASTRVDIEAVRRYYDRHSAAFVAVGQRGSEGALHRAVWGPGTETRWQAFRYVEDRIAALLETLPAADEPLHVVDLGCGVGASLCYLAGRLPIQGTGVTISPVQVGIAGDRIRAAGLTDRVRCLEGDYRDDVPGLAPADLAYAIESFVHGPAPAQFFARCARLVRSGGLLVICDDVRRPTSGRAAARTIDRFRRGWHVHALLDRNDIGALAAAAGFSHVSTTDLSPWLEIRRARDRAVSLLLAPIQWLPLQHTRLGYLQGGSALQTCLARGWIGYDFMVFRRDAHA